MKRKNLLIIIIVALPLIAFAQNSRNNANRTAKPTRSTDNVHASSRTNSTRTTATRSNPSSNRSSSSVSRTTTNKSTEVNKNNNSAYRGNQNSYSSRSTNSATRTTTNSHSNGNGHHNSNANRSHNNGNSHVNKNTNSRNTTHASHTTTNRHSNGNGHHNSSANRSHNNGNHHANNNSSSRTTTHVTRTTTHKNDGHYTNDRTYHSNHNKHGHQTYHHNNVNRNYKHNYHTSRVYRHYDYKPYHHGSHHNYVEYRRPVHVNVYWDRHMYYDYCKIYPEISHWSYTYGTVIHTVSAYNAYYHIGEVRRVYGRVDEVFYARETDEYYLYFGATYPNHDFSIVVPGRIARSISRTPSWYFQNQYVVTTGLVTSFNGRAEIVVRRANQLNIY